MTTKTPDPAAPPEIEKAMDHLVDVAGEEGYDCNIYRENPRILAAKSTLLSAVAAFSSRAAEEVNAVRAVFGLLPGEPQNIGRTLAEFVKGSRETLAAQRDAAVARALAAEARAERAEAERDEARVAANTNADQYRIAFDRVQALESSERALRDGIRALADDVHEQARQRFTDAPASWHMLVKIEERLRALVADHAEKEGK